jgi:hypothetical protein
MKKILFITLAFICAGAAHGQKNGSVYNPDGIELVYVEGNEILESFYIGKYEVTQAQYEAVMGVNPSHFKGSNHPVEMVSWINAMEFIVKLNTRTGRKYRLPTREEWIYAALGGNSVNRYSGSINFDSIAWYKYNSGNTTHPVGLKRPNPLGVYDMFGNVREWGEGDFTSKLLKVQILRGTHGIGIYDTNKTWEQLIYITADRIADDYGFRVVLKKIDHKTFDKRRRK